MEQVTISSVNKDFLKEAADRGYKSYVDSLKSNDPATKNAYLGSVQKRITDDKGCKYFISIDMYEPRKIGIERDGIMSTVETQFHTQESWRGKSVNVSFSFEGFQDAEAEMERIWTTLGFAYYEKN